MRILLVNPINPSYYRRFKLITPPLGLGYLSSSLRREGHQVTILDANVQPFAARTYNYAAYDLVGVSSDTARFPWAQLIAESAKGRGVPVVMGGPHASVAAPAILESGTADYVVLGEGEESFPRLVAALAEGDREPELDGVGFRRRDGTVRISPTRFIDDLDSLPLPDWEALSLDKYRWTPFGHRAMSIVASRGCPYDCDFCSVSQLFGRRWRKRSIASVIEEMEILVNDYLFDYLVFFDDNFTVNPKRVIELSEEILRRQVKVEWMAFSRADEIVGHEDMVEAMAAAGCRMLFIGFESAHDEVLKELNKKASASVAHEAVAILKRHGIDTFASFILGAERDTRSTIRDTVRFARRLGARIVEFSILTPLPGTRLYRRLESRLLTRDFSRYDLTHLVFRHPAFSPEELRRIFVRAYVSVYITPDKLFSFGLPFLKQLLATRGQAKAWQREATVLAHAHQLR